jgi:hypothetical protein
MSNYTSTGTTTFIIPVDIKDCQFTSYTHELLQPTTNAKVTQPLTLTVSDFVMEPDCGNTYSYKISMVYTDQYNLTNFQDFLNFDGN